MKNMKNIFLAIASLAIIVMIAITFPSSKNSNAIRWPFADVNEVSVTSADTITATGLIKGYNFIDLDTDTNIVFNATVTALELGDFLLIEATESSANADTISWGTGITGTSTALASGKTKEILFIFTGTALKKVAETQVD